MSSAALESFRSDGRPVVAVVRASLFNASEGFVQAHAAGLERFQPLIVGVERQGGILPQLADRLVLPRNAAEAFAFKAFGPSASLIERVRAFAPVLVHAHFATDGLLALPLARALGVPLVTTLHGYDVGRSRRRMLLSGRLSWMRYALAGRRLREAGDLFLPVSESLRAGAIERGYPAARTETHYLGVDPVRYSPAGATPEPGLILHIGRLVEKKGTRLLIDAMARLSRAASLVVIGDGPERAALERQAASLGDRVRFLGALGREDVAAWLRRACVLAVPSITAWDGDREGLPMVLLEAAACGVPAVGSRHSGIPEGIVHGETGFLAPEGDVAALAEALAEIIGSSELRYRFGRGARALIEDRFDARRQIASLESRYIALIGADRRQPG